MSLFRLCFPLVTELCSAELFGHKFTIPCKLKENLSANYGLENQWSQPLKKYKLKNLDWSRAEIRSEYELPYMYRYYKANGSVDVIKTLNTINEKLEKLNKTKISKLPIDENEFI